MIVSVTLDVPATNGVGDPSNISAFGGLWGLLVLGEYDGLVTIEGGSDGVDFAPIKQVEGAGLSAVTQPVVYVRVRRSGTTTGTPSVIVMGGEAGAPPPYSHYEHGLAIFDGTQDDVTVAFSSAFLDALYETGGSLVSNDPGVITWSVTAVTTEGMTLRPSIRFTGRISWWAGAT